ncbi:11916_t:CDS:2, partial [Entrophospora sp. SA101]
PLPHQQANTPYPHHLANRSPFLVETRICGIIPPLNGRHATNVHPEPGSNS